MLNVKFSARFSIPSISNQFKRVTQFICFIHERNRIINEWRHAFDLSSSIDYARCTKPCVHKRIYRLTPSFCLRSGFCYVTESSAEWHCQGRPVCVKHDA